MRMHPWKYLASTLFLILVCAGCDSRVAEQLGVVTASDLSGTYTGVLEGVSVDHLDDVDDREQHIIVDLDLLHELTIEETGELMVRIESGIVPPLRALILGVGSVAINAEFVEFEGLDLSDRDPHLDALKVKQIIFVKYEGEWVLVFQLVRIGVEPTVDEVYLYQYVSYPSSVARRLSNEEAIVYVNTILRLASAIQRL